MRPDASPALADPARADAWVWGWDEAPGLVSVWAEPSGRVHVWRRDPAARAVVHEVERFRPWLLLASLEDLEADGRHVAPARPGRRGLTFRELEGDGALRFLVEADAFDELSSSVARGASARLGREIGHARQLGDDEALALPLDEQYLVATGRTFFRGLAEPDVTRLQLDLETTGLDPSRDRVFLVAVRDPDGRATTLEARGGSPDDEAELLARVVAHVRAADPDVIENHNLHGFDLPFLVERARVLGVPLALGRLPGVRPRARAARRGRPTEDGRPFEIRYTVPGRELIDTLDAVRRHDFATRELESHRLKDVARHLGVADEHREIVPGAEIFTTWLRDPERVRRYATQDVEEVAAIGRLLGGAAFALARMAPRRYERLADAGPATGVLDPMLVRAYLREGRALPAPAQGDGTVHTGAALHLFAAGVAERVVKADVASLYPSLMRQHRIGPAGDSLGALVAIVDRLTALRLDAKARGKAAEPGSPERWENEATSAAMKLVVNSAYGYLAAVGLVRFSDVHAANEVTRRGRAVLALLCRELDARGVTLLEADTDGVYFAMPEGATEADERRIVREVGALLPPLVRLEHDGRWAAMLSHEPKNYALLGWDGAVELRGVAFRSSRAEPFAIAFLRRALERLLRGDVAGVRRVYVETALALRRRELPTRALAMRVRLTKTPEDYRETRAARREAAYEALLAAGREAWSPGDRVLVVRDARGRPRLVAEEPAAHDAHDYDADHYLRVLRETWATRLERALAPDDFDAVFADPAQGALFERSLAGARPVLVRVRGVDGLDDA
jgi:DNA polymerase elongation subunit (family B)